MTGKTWTPPKYKSINRLPFIPTEKEMDQPIAGCNKKTTAFLQLLKETGIRSGEAFMLKWTDLDFEKKAANVTPEKGGEPRILRVSDKVIAMLNYLPKEHPTVFKGSLEHLRRSYGTRRKKIAYKLTNKRIEQRTFHTFRHWKAR